MEHCDSTHLFVLLSSHSLPLLFQRLPSRALLNYDLFFPWETPARGASFIFSLCHFFVGLSADLNGNMSKGRRCFSLRCGIELLLPTKRASWTQLLFLIYLFSCRLSIAANMTFTSGFLKLVDCIGDAPRQAAYIPIGTCIHDSTAVSLKDSNVLAGTDVNSVKYTCVSLFLHISDFHFHHP